MQSRLFHVVFSIDITPILQISKQATQVQLVKLKRIQVQHNPQIPSR